MIKLSEVGLPVSHDRFELKGHPVPAGIAFSRDGKRVYVAFSRNNTLAVIDAETRQVTREVEVGIAPFSVAPGRGRIYVSNRGGRRPSAKDTTAPSSGTAVATDPVTGSTTTGTLSVVDPETWSVRELATGLAPSHMALSADEKLLAVANSHSDTVTIVETDKGTTTEVKIPAFPEAALGSQPVSTLFTPDAKTAVCGVRRE